MYPVPKTLFSRLLNYFAQAEQFAFFDTSRPCSENRMSYLFTSPETRLQCEIGDDPFLFLETVQEWVDRGFWVAGWFGYEFGYLLDKRVSGLTNGPLRSGRRMADLGVYSQPLVFDHRTAEENISQIGCDDRFSSEYRLGELCPNISEQEYLDALEKVKEYIKAGDTYQVNLTLKLLFSLQGSPEALYSDLRRNQSVAYGAFIRWGQERVMSFSPELFFRKNDESLVARPMKGTLKRGRTQEEDRLAAEFLQNDSKNCSENVMIVDLLRNDLGRVLHESGNGKVSVRSLFDVETYESLFQMTSTIDGVGEGGCLKGLSLATLFKGLFPCGSVTGAPKIRTMEIIAELEKEYRGVYTGAIGFLSPAGEGVFNVPIRTVVLDGEQGEMGIGSGVTDDSDSGDEWNECLLKGKFLTEPAPVFLLIETLLWDPENGYLLLEEHLKRLAGSAEYFYFYCDIATIRKGLIDEARKCPVPSRVRLTLAKEGDFEISSSACDLPKTLRIVKAAEDKEAALPKVRFSKGRTDSTNRWLFHKTTRRELYDEEFQQAVSEGFFDTLFLNEAGQVTEGAITNILLLKDGRYLTPSVDCGLLRGVMLQALMKDKEIQIEEQTIYPEDVRSAEALFCCNSVRGVVRVALNE